MKTASASKSRRSGLFEIARFVMATTSAGTATTYAPPIDQRAGTFGQPEELTMTNRSKLESKAALTLAALIAAASIVSSPALAGSNGKIAGGRLTFPPVVQHAPTTPGAIHLFRDPLNSRYDAVYMRFCSGGRCVSNNLPR